MASVSRKNGFKVVKHTNGSPYNGQANLYFMDTTDATIVMVGDLVKLGGTARAATGAATVTRCAAGDIPLGVVVGIIYTGVGDAQNVPPVNSLDTPIYRRASTNRYVLVADAIDLVLEAELLSAGAFTVDNVGLNVNYDTAAGSTVTGSSGMSIDISTVTTTNTIPLKLIGFPNRPDNVPGDSFLSVYVMFNTHNFKGLTGTQGL